MALTFAVPTNGTGTDTTDGTTFTTGSISFVAGRLYVIACAATGSSASTPTVSGSSTGSWSALTPTSISFNPVSGAASRLNCFSVTPGSSVSETLTITYGATRTVAAWGVVEITGHATSGTFVQGDAANSNSATSVQGMTNNAMSIAAFGDATNNALLMFVANANANAVTPSGSLLELFDISGATPSIRLESCYQIGENTAPDATWSSSNAAAMAWEVKAAATALTVSPSGSDVTAQSGTAVYSESKLIAINLRWP